MKQTLKKYLRCNCFISKKKIRFRALTSNWRCTRCDERTVSHLDIILIFSLWYLWKYQRTTFELKTLNTFYGEHAITTDFGIFHIIHTFWMLHTHKSRPYNNVKRVIFHVVWSRIFWWNSSTLIDGRRGAIVCWVHRWKVSTKGKCGSKCTHHHLHGLPAPSTCFLHFTMTICRFHVLTFS